MSFHTNNKAVLMGKLDAVLGKVLKIVNSKSIVAIKKGFMLTMPLTIIGALFLLLAFIPIDVYGEFMSGIFGPEWSTLLFQVVGATFDILAMIGAFGIAYTYVKSEHLFTTKIYKGYLK